VTAFPRHERSALEFHSNTLFNPGEIKPPLPFRMELNFLIW
jgi:hypothetical protein